MIKFRNDKKTLIMIVSICTAFVLLFSGIIAAIILGGDKNEDTPAPQVEKKDLFAEEIRGVWVASVFNINFPSRPNLSESELKAELDEIVATTESAGLNTVFFQVRPSCDALYKSEIYPVSRYLSEDGQLTLDTLQYLIEKAHEKNIKVHAWINPLRVSTGGSIEALSYDSPARKNSQMCVTYSNKLYYNCGLPEVREQVCEGISEIVRNYQVDGIVFDDYFYPYPAYNDDGTLTEFDDAETFAKYGGDFETIGDWRRANVNELVKSVYETVKNADVNCLFGVSPFGIWKNGYGDETGSATSGTQSYSDIFCDTLAWVNGKYVDYIAPQLYWNNEEKVAPYDALLNWWSQRLEGTDTKLVVCHGAYRYDEWENPEGEMTRQTELAKKSENYAGSVFYGYSQIAEDRCGIRAELAKMYAGDR